MNTDNLSILYFGREKIEIYSQSDGAIVNFNLGPKYIQENKIINKDELYHDLQNFLTSMNVGPGNAIMVIGALAEYASKPDDYNGLRMIFKKMGFDTDFIMPEYIYNFEREKAADYIPDTLDYKKTAIIFRDTFLNKNYNLIFTQVNAQEKPDFASYDPEAKYLKNQRKRDILRLYALSSVFGMVITAVFVIWLVNPLPQTYHGKAFLDRFMQNRETQELSLKIISCAQSKRLASEIDEAFDKYKFKRKSLEFNSDKFTCPVDQNTLLLSGKISNEVRGMIFTEAKNRLNGLTVLDNPTPPWDIILIISDSN